MVRSSWGTWPSLSSAAVMEVAVKAELLKMSKFAMAMVPFQGGSAFRRGWRYGLPAGIRHLAVPCSRCPARSGGSRRYAPREQYGARWPWQPDRRPRRRLFQQEVPRPRQRLSAPKMECLAEIGRAHV